jgi:hypothetical protein
MKSYIFDIVQKVVDKEFVSNLERKVLDHDTRINFRCPYCHEGRTKTKKRGNIYLDKLLYICFRCGKKTTFDKFARDFNQQIDPEHKLEMINHLESVSNYSDYNDDFMDTSIENLISLEDIKLAIEKNYTPLTDFTPIKKNGGVYKYLIGRGIPEQYHENIYQAKFWKNEEQYEWVIVMLNRRGDKVLGMQLRNLKSGKRRLFNIYNYEHLMEWANLVRPNPIELSVNEIVVYNKLSYYYNILNVSFEDTITIFEGYLDSLFFPNAIGLVGVNTDGFFLENNGLDLRFVYDNDEVGYKKSLEKIKDYPVFLWVKLFEYIVSTKKTNDPHALLERISKVKDMNKLSELVPNCYSKLNLEDFFSKDIYDKIWLKKIKRQKKEERDYKILFEKFDKN